MNKLKISTFNGIQVVAGKRAFLGNSLSTCSYWVDGVIVDTGPRSLSEGFKEFFDSKPIEKLVVTHSHEDHCGNAAFFNQKGVPVYLHQSAVVDVAKPVQLPLYRWIFWRPRPPFQANPLPDVIETTKGKAIHVIPAPGHAPDHVAYLYPEEGALFTGDLFVSPSTKMGMPEENYAEWMQTLQKLLEYDFDILCCGHSGIIPNGKQMLAKKLQKLQELKDRILDLREKGWTAREIDQKLFPNTVQVKFLSGGEWDSIHIVRSFINNS